MNGKAYLLVRAVVTNPADRQPFDHWYSTDHMPAALARFGAAEGWRFWSHTDPAIHYALYEFQSIAELQCVMDSEKTKSLIADFDRVWGLRVERTRELIEQVDRLLP